VGQSLRTGLIGAAVGGLVIWGVMTQAVGADVTECGFDAHGTYARVRVNNVLGGAQEQPVTVDFRLDGAAEPYATSTDWPQAPAHSRLTTVLHAYFPPSVVRLEDGTTTIVEGRTVYRETHRTGKFVTREFAEEHPHRTQRETVPEDWTLDCSVRDDD
jgi:hypothetical protein